jgi:hypothetical protein
MSSEGQGANKRDGLLQDRFDKATMARTSGCSRNGGVRSDIQTRTQLYFAVTAELVSECQT